MPMGTQRLSAKVFLATSSPFLRRRIRRLWGRRAFGNYAVFLNGSLPAGLLLSGCSSLRFAVAFFLVFANRRFLAREPEKIFVPVGITLGVLVCLLTPVQTSVSWDDHIHYDFANAVSYLVSPEYSQADMSLLNPPYIGGGDYSHWMYQGDAYGSLISELDAEGLAPAITVDGFGSVYGSSTLSYQALGYIPSALGLWLGRLLHLPFTWIFILGRISNVLFFFTLVFFGVRGLRSQRCSHWRSLSCLRLYFFPPITRMTHGLPAGFFSDSCGIFPGCKNQMKH